MELSPPAPLFPTAGDGRQSGPHAGDGKHGNPRRPTLALGSPSVPAAGPSGPQAALPATPLPLGGAGAGGCPQL